MIVIDPKGSVQSCFVIDLKLPGISGLEYLAEIRRRGERAPAILITSPPLQSARSRAAAMGAPIFEKPLLDDRLAIAVRNLGIGLSAERFFAEGHSGRSPI